MNKTYDIKEHEWELPLRHCWPPGMMIDCEPYSMTQVVGIVLKDAGCLAIGSESQFAFLDGRAPKVGQEKIFKGRFKNGVEYLIAFTGVVKHAKQAIERIKTLARERNAKTIQNILNTVKHGMRETRDEMVNRRHFKTTKQEQFDFLEEPQQYFELMVACFLHRKAHLITTRINDLRHAEHERYAVIGMGVEDGLKFLDSFFNKEQKMVWRHGIPLMIESLEQVKIQRPAACGGLISLGSISIWIGEKPEAKVVYGHDERDLKLIRLYCDKLKLLRDSGIGLTYEILERVDVDVRTEIGEWLKINETQAGQANQ